jgi:hypothetical protein
MATEKSFSYAAFVAYGNACINNASGRTPEMQAAFRTDLKKAIAKAGYPQKDEIGIIDTINDFDMSATMHEIPNLVSGFMHDEKRAFNLPAPDKKTAPATLKVVSVGKKTKTGIIQMGDKKGQQYSSTTAAHEEVKVKNNTDEFKK